MFKKILFISAVLLSVIANSTNWVINSGNFYYSPSTLTINIGDTVTWVNDGGLHNVNFDTNSISGISFNNPESFTSSPTNDSLIYSHIFNIVGLYNYDCSVGSHAQNGMIGSLVVDEPGCMDSSACNYNPNATIDDGSCLFNSAYSFDSISACDSYTWINGVTYNQSISNVTDTLVNSVGCDSVVFLILEILSSPTITGIENNVLCFGESNGSIDLTIFSPNLQSIIWSNGQITEDIDSLISDVYNVLVIDSNLCSSTNSFTISEPNALSLSFASNNLLCFQDSSGSIDLNISGGTPNYSFSWNNGSTNEDLSNLQAGSYNVSVYDNNNCFISGSINIDQPDTLISFLSHTNILCNGDLTGSIQVTTNNGGTSPYLYFLNGSSSNTGVFNNLGANNYFVSVVDDNNCSTSQSISLTEPLLLNSSIISFSNILCFGDSSGFIDLSVSGGVYPYSFSWNNDAFITEDISGIPMGNYNVIVTDSNNCTNSSNQILTESEIIDTSISLSICSWDRFTVGINDYNVSGLYIDTLIALNNCDSIVYLNLTVFDTISSGSISENQFLCYNSIPLPHYFDVNSSGADGLFSYVWQSSLDSNTWSLASASTNSTTYQPNSLSNTTFFRVQVTSDFGCGVVFTNNIKDSVYNQLTSSLISDDQSICFNTSPDTLNIVQLSSGGGVLNNDSYTWQTSSNGSNWQFYSNGIQFNPTNLVSDKYYRVQTISDFNCGPSYSNEVLITVYDNFLAGNIVNSENICYNTTPNLLSFNTQPSGADGNYTYNWQLSLNALTWDSIPSTDSLFFQPPALDTSHFYRVIVSSDYGCGSLLTNTILVYVYDEFLVGSLNMFDTICYNTLPDLITTDLDAVGGNTPYSYEWSIYDSLANQWNVQTINNNNFYNPGALITTSDYRVKFISNSGCGEHISNISNVFVFPEVIPATITSNQVICYDSLASNLNIIFPPTGGNNLFNYRWQSSFNSSNWNSASGTNNDTFYSPGNMTTSKFFRLENTSSFSNLCIPRYSDTILIEVLNPLTAGSISSNQTICYNTVPAQISFNTAPDGANGDYLFQWQESIDNNNWIIINGASTSSLQPPSLLESTYYRVKVTSNFGCGFKFTSPVLINVYDDFNPGIISDNDTICLGDDINNIQLSSPSIGSDGIYSYQWQFNDSGFWDNINSANNTDYQPLSLADSTLFRLNVTTLCGDLNTNSINIVVNPLPLSYQITGDFNVCNNQNYSDYTLSVTSDDYRYFWYTNGGDFVGTNESKECIINWSPIIGDFDLFVDTYVYETGCSITTSEIVTIEVESSPFECSILLKENSNILIASDSSFGLNYQWGYDNKQTNQSEIFLNDTLRYIQLSNSIDTNLYSYWVDTYYDYSNVSCFTRSYFNSPPNPLFVDDYFKDISIFPNPVKDILNFKIPTHFIDIQVMDFLGRKIDCPINFNSNSIDFSQFNSGVYFIVFKSNNKTLTRKIILN